MIDSLCATGECQELFGNAEDFPPYLQLILFGRRLNGPPSAVSLKGMEPAKIYQWNPRGAKGYGEVMFV
jgi:hypothetical protein